MGPCFAQLSLTSCVPETAAAVAATAACSNNGHSNSNNNARETKNNNNKISTEMAKANNVPVLAAVVAFFC